MLRYPVACPNSCQVGLFERQELEDHLEENCPLTVIDCPFNHAGCDVELPHRDMTEHMQDAATHLEMLATLTRTLMEEIQTLTESDTYEQQTRAESEFLSLKLKI